MATWSLLRSSTSAIHSTLKTIPCWFAFRYIIEEAFAPVQQLWPQARVWSDLRGWTPYHRNRNSSVVFFFNFKCKRVDTVLFTLGLKSNSCHRLSSECVKREDFISDSSITKDRDAISHFRIVQKLKNRVEAERTSLQFPLYKQRKMQICPLNFDFVLLFLHNSKVTYWRINAWFSRWANRNHEWDSFKTYNNEKEKFQKIFKNPFGHSLKSAWHSKYPFHTP